MMETKKLIYILPIFKASEVVKYGQYTFKFAKDKQPIPVVVPSDIAEILLQMTDRSCRCHYRPPKFMFKEVV